MASIVEVNDFAQYFANTYRQHYLNHKRRMRILHFELKDNEHLWKLYKNPELFKAIQIVLKNNYNKSLQIYQYLNYNEKLQQLEKAICILMF